MTVERIEIVGKDEAFRLAETNHHEPLVNQEGEVSSGARENFDQ